MAYIRAHETAQKRKGKSIKRYEVCWREPNPTQPGKMRSRQESYTTREVAEARRDALNNAKHTIGGTASLADAKKAGERLFGEYAASWADDLDARVADPGDALKGTTAAKYKRLLEFYVLPELGGVPIGAIDAAACRKFRAVLVKRSSRVGGVDAKLSAGTIKHIWGVLRAVLDLAFEDGATTRNHAAPTKRRRRGTGPKAKSKHHPLNIEQLGALSAALDGHAIDSGTGQPVPLPSYPVYALMVEFMAATGLRASEVAGLEIHDLIRRPVVTESPPRMAVRVKRTKERKGGDWIVGDTKSDSSYLREVPLPPWLVERMDDYLAEHPRADEPTAPLWPGRSARWTPVPGTSRRQTALDWSAPLDMPTFYRRVFRPALLAAGLPASEPATLATKATPARPATHGVRLHDLRHSAAALWLSSGENIVKVSHMLGHADPGVTLSVYAAYVTERPAENNMPAPTRRRAPASNVAPIRRQAG